MTILVSRKSTLNILMGIRLPSMPIFILYIHVVIAWLLWFLSFAIITELTLLMLKTFDLTMLFFLWVPMSLQHPGMFHVMLSTFLCLLVFSPACLHFCKLSPNDPLIHTSCNFFYVPDICRFIHNATVFAVSLPFVFYFFVLPVPLLC